MPKMIPARQSQLSFYRNVPLYVKNTAENFVLYKPAGITIREMRIEEGRIPPNLYIRMEDKIQGIQEAQKGFNHQLADYVKSEVPEKIKDTVVSVVTETLEEPRSGSLEGISDTVDILISDYSRETNVVNHLLDLSRNDYTTILHSINVMAFALGFAFYEGWDLSRTKVLGLSALLHDTGKTKINAALLRSSRKLTDKEFYEIKKHPDIGYRILGECRFNNQAIRLAALEHHEKLDGSGYPYGKTDINTISQIISIIDCYEAITNDDRPYRSALSPLNALELLKDDVEKGKFDKYLFERFAYSLV